MPKHDAHVSEISLKLRDVARRGEKGDQVTHQEVALLEKIEISAHYTRCHVRIRYATLRHVVLHSFTERKLIGYQLHRGHNDVELSLALNPSHSSSNRVFWPLLFKCFTFGVFLNFVFLSYCLGD